MCFVLCIHILITCFWLHIGHYIILHYVLYFICTIVRLSHSLLKATWRLGGETSRGRTDKERNVQLPVYSRVGPDTVDFRFRFRFSAESEISAFGRPLEQTNIYIFDYNGGSVLLLFRPPVQPKQCLVTQCPNYWLCSVQCAEFFQLFTPRV